MVNFNNVNWKRFYQEDFDVEPELIGSTLNGPFTLTSTGNSSDSISISNPNVSGDTIYIGDNPEQWRVGDAVEWQQPYNPWQPIQPLVPGPIYPDQIRPFGADPNPGLVIGWPPPQQEKKILNAEELMSFLEALECIEKEMMTKIKKAILPDQKPIDYNNRIDDLILDI